MEEEIIETLELTEPTEPTEAEASEPAEEVADPAPAEPTAEELAAKKENRVQKRIDEITREKHEARQETEKERQEKEYWRKLATGEIKPQPVPPSPLQSDDFVPPGYRPEPQLDQFDDWDQYNRAVLRWEAGKIVATRDFVEAEKRAAEAERDISRGYNQRVEASKDKYPDYDDVVRSANTIKFPNSTLRTIEESEQSADIAYFLASNPKEAERVSSLDTVKQIKEIAKLEVKFSSSPAPPPKRVTQAPAPIGAIAGSDSGIVDESKMTDAQWLAHERKRLAAQGRRY